MIDVDILGHIFEQSITDLEQLRNELDGLVAPLGKEKHKTRRKKEGAFYTPHFITRYIVEQTLGMCLPDGLRSCGLPKQARPSGAAAKALADPRVYNLLDLKRPQREAPGPLLGSVARGVEQPPACWTRPAAAARS